MYNFDKAINQTLGKDKLSEARDVLDVDSNEELIKARQAYRDKYETKKINLDMSKISYKKQGTMEQVVSLHVEDVVKVPPIGTEKSGKELLEEFQISTEVVEPPAFISDKYGNIWVRI